MSKFFRSALSSSSSSESSSGVSSDGDKKSSTTSASSSSSSTSSKGLGGKQAEEKRKHFLRTIDGDEKNKKPKAVRVQPGVKGLAKPLAGGGEEEEEGSEASSVTKGEEEGWQRGRKPLFDPKVDVTPTMVLEKLSELSLVPGRKGWPLHKLNLQELLDVAESKKMNVAVVSKIRLSIINFLFEFYMGKQSMSRSGWSEVLAAIDQLVSLIQGSDHPIVVTVAVVPEDELLLKAGEADSSNANKVEKDDRPYVIHASLVSLLKRLDMEFYNITKASKSPKVKHEALLADLLEKCQHYVEVAKSSKWIPRGELISLHTLRLQHRYYKYTPDDPTNEESMARLCKSIFALRPTKQDSQRVLLRLVYHHSIHDRYEKAKALILSSRIQAYIVRSDFDTIVLYHRAICQLGMSVFRAGHIDEAHQILFELMNNHYVRLLLGQRGFENLSPEQEMLQRRVRSIPVHMQIDVELARLIFWLCCMLRESSLMVATELTFQRPFTTRTFHRMLIQVEEGAMKDRGKKTVTARNGIHSATQALLKGDWKLCKEHVMGTAMEEQVWNSCHDSLGKLKQVVESRIKEEALKIYIHLNSRSHSSLSVQELSEHFEMDKSSVAAVIGKLIIQDEEGGLRLDESMDNLLSDREPLDEEELEVLKVAIKLDNLLQLFPRM